MSSQKAYLDIEDLVVYRRLCELHIEVCDLSHAWPTEEKYELGSQVRRSSNSAPAQLAEKNNDRHLKNKIEGINRSRGETCETIHHLYMAQLKGYIDREAFEIFRDKYKECIRMLNGLEKSIEQHLPAEQRRWGVSEEPSAYAVTSEVCLAGWPDLSECPEFETFSDNRLSLLSKIHFGQNGPSAQEEKI